jgi:hypothetical protein
VLPCDPCFFCNILSVLGPETQHKSELQSCYRKYFLSICILEKEMCHLNVLRYCFLCSKSWLKVYIFFRSKRYFTFEVGCALSSISGGFFFKTSLYFNLLVCYWHIVLIYRKLRIAVLRGHFQKYKLILVSEFCDFFVKFL